MTLAPDGATAETGPDGVARLPLPAASGGPPALARLVVRRGADDAILPADPPGLEGASGWVADGGADPWRFLVLTGLARPERGAEVPVVGWVRLRGCRRSRAPGASARGRAGVVGDPERLRPAPRAGAPT
ncbi:MAG: hypothetical protein H6745_02330 [Deltaproteobacteria bacterium]|nr:hypothetical protein [Deltaproteobacteria bacterium]